MFAVAIDGPAGAGKSTVAREAARRLGFLYLDTGALYRAVALAFVREGADYTEAAASALLGHTRVETRFAETGGQAVLLNGEDVTETIRAPEISAAASRCSALPSVRAFLLDTQRGIAAAGPVVMDGRDIGTVVLPNANVKIFLTASPEVRAKRRYDELRAKGSKILFSDVLDELKKRDYNDTHRQIAPLRQAEDAVLLNTDGLDFEQTVSAVLARVGEVRA